VEECTGPIVTARENCAAPGLVHRLCAGPKPDPLPRTRFSIRNEGSCRASAPSSLAS